jgi:hypothetical protein
MLRCIFEIVWKGHTVVNRTMGWRMQCKATHLFILSKGCTTKNTRKQRTARCRQAIVMGTLLCSYNASRHFDSVKGIGWFRPHILLTQIRWIIWNKGRLSQNSDLKRVWRVVRCQLTDSLPFRRAISTVDYGMFYWPEWKVSSWISSHSWN